MYVIYNHHIRLSEALDQLLHYETVHALDAATAYIIIAGFELLRDGLKPLPSLLLDAEPSSGDDIGQRVRCDLKHTH